MQAWTFFMTQKPFVTYICPFEDPTQLEYGIRITWQIVRSFLVAKLTVKIKNNKNDFSARIRTFAEWWLLIGGVLDVLNPLQTRLQSSPAPGMGQIKTFVFLLMKVKFNPIKSRNFLLLEPWGSIEALICRFKRITFIFKKVTSCLPFDCG